MIIRDGEFTLKKIKSVQVNKCTIKWVKDVK